MGRFRLRRRGIRVDRVVDWLDEEGIRDESEELTVIPGDERTTYRIPVKWGLLSEQEPMFINLLLVSDWPDRISVVAKLLLDEEQNEGMKELTESAREEIAKEVLESVLPYCDPQLVSFRLETTMEPLQWGYMVFTSIFEDELSKTSLIRAIERVARYASWIGLIIQRQLEDYFRTPPPPT